LQLGYLCDALRSPGFEFAFSEIEIADELPRARRVGTEIGRKIDAQKISHTAMSSSAR
jgi:hypothetical protein